jgi:hypothetical protein
METVVKRKIPRRRRESNSRTPIFQPVAQRYTDWAITALSKKQDVKEWRQNYLIMTLIISAGLDDRGSRVRFRGGELGIFLLTIASRTALAYWQRVVPFAVLAPGGQSWNFWIHVRIARKTNLICSVWMGTSLPLREDCNIEGAWERSAEVNICTWERE